ELGESLCRIAGLIEPELFREIGLGGLGEDRLGKEPGAPPIERLRARIFIEERLELDRAAMAPGFDQARRHMADGDGADAALRSRRVARIVDDEGLDDWHRAEHDLRGAILRERHGLAGQPFERAMRAAM